MPPQRERAGIIARGMRATLRDPGEGERAKSPEGNTQIRWAGGRGKGAPVYGKFCH